MNTFAYVYQVFPGESPRLVNTNTVPSDVHYSEFPYTIGDDGAVTFPLEDGYLVYTDNRIQ